MIWIAVLMLWQGDSDQVRFEQAQHSPLKAVAATLSRFSSNSQPPILISRRFGLRSGHSSSMGRPIAPWSTGLGGLCESTRAGLKRRLCTASRADLGKTAK
jgi:hypothetical protein